MDYTTLDRKSLIDNTEVIDYILDLANKSNSNLLKRTRYLLDVSLPTYRLLRDFLCKDDTPITKNADVPIKNIFGSFRSFASYGDPENISWLEMLNKYIVGGESKVNKGWTQEDLEYFQGDLSGAMPSNASLIKLESYAGITSAYNGNHRLISIYCLLSAIHDDPNAVFKNVQVAFHRPITSRFNFLKAECNDFDEIYMDDSDKSKYEFLLINSAHTTWRKFAYNVKEEKYSCLEEKKNNFLIRKTFDLDPRKWWKIEKEMMEFIFNDIWFSEQIS